ncbi:MAG: hypothetical protein HQL06_05725 [Nitrospirae bacterium]|nr:hypothetical protein [Nitrospirota bacterium]
MGKKIPLNQKGKHFEVKTPPNYNECHITFSFRLMRKGSKCCLSLCRQIDKAHVADKLLSLGQMTWKQIHQVSRKGLGFEMIPVGQLKIAMPSHINEDVKEVMIFKFSDSGRLAGIRERDIFYVIFVAPNHNLY